MDYKTPPRPPLTSAVCSEWTKFHFCVTYSLKAREWHGQHDLTWNKDGNESSHSPTDADSPLVLVFFTTELEGEKQATGCFDNELKLRRWLCKQLRVNFDQKLNFLMYVTFRFSLFSVPVSSSPSSSPLLFRAHRVRPFLLSVHSFVVPSPPPTQTCLHKHGSSPNVNTTATMSRRGEESKRQRWDGGRGSVCSLELATFVALLHHFKCKPSACVVIVFSPSFLSFFPPPALPIAFAEANESMS